MPALYGGEVYRDIAGRVISGGMSNGASPMEVLDTLIHGSSLSVNRGPSGGYEEWRAELIARADSPRAISSQSMDAVNRVWGEDEEIPIETIPDIRKAVNNSRTVICEENEYVFGGWGELISFNGKRAFGLNQGDDLLAEENGLFLYEDSYRPYKSMSIELLISFKHGRQTHIKDSGFWEYLRKKTEFKFIPNKKYKDEFGELKDGTIKGFKYEGRVLLINVGEEWLSIHFAENKQSIILQLSYFVDNSIGG